ncbi:hypothetical protein DIPPA_15587 [Diplonema papillatum]|nr:hypothetical protein DIPPA_15587 [Diplonema papillatum]
MEEEEKNSSDGDYAFDVEATPELKAPHQENDSSNVFQDLTVDGDDEIAEPDKSSCSSFAEEGDTTESPQKEAVPEVDDEDIDLDQGQDQDPKKIYGDTAPNTPSQLSETQATGAKQESEKNGTPTKSDSHGKGQDTDVFDTLSQDDASTNRDATKTSSRPAAVAQVEDSSPESTARHEAEEEDENSRIEHVPGQQPSNRTASERSLSEKDEETPPDTPQKKSPARASSTSSSYCSNTASNTDPKEPTATSAVGESVSEGQVQGPENGVATDKKEDKNDDSGKRGSILDKQIPSASSSSRSKASSSVDAKNPEVDTANKRETDPNENEEASESGMRENGVSNMKDDGSIAEETPIAKVEEDAKENGRRESVLDKDVASSASSYSCEAPADDKAQDGTAANKTHSEDASEAQGGQGERVSNGNGGNEEEARDRRESVLDKEMPTDSESDSSYTSDSEASGEQTPMSTQRTAAETVPVGVVLPGDPHHSEKVDEPNKNDTTAHNASRSSSPGSSISSSSYTAPSHSPVPSSQQESGQDLKTHDATPPSTAHTQASRRCSIPESAVKRAENKKSTNTPSEPRPRQVRSHSKSSEASSLQQISRRGSNTSVPSRMHRNLSGSKQRTSSSSARKPAKKPSNYNRPLTNPEARPRHQMDCESGIITNAPVPGTDVKQRTSVSTAGDGRSSLSARDKTNGVRHQTKATDRKQAWQTGGSPVDKQRFIAQLKEKNVSLHEAVAVITAQLQELFNRPSHEKAEKARQKVSDRRLKILEEEIRVQQQANKALEKRCKEATKRDKLEGKLSHTEEAAEELKRLNLKMKADQRDNEKKLKLFADPDSVVRAAYRGFKEETKVLKTQVERMERQRQQALAHADFQHKRLKQLEKEDTYPDVSAADMKRAADLSQKAAALDDEQEALEYRLAVLRRQKDTSKRFAEVQKAAEEKAEVDFLKKELKDLRKELGLRTEHSDASAAKARKRRSVNAASSANDAQNGSNSPARQNPLSSDLPAVSASRQSSPKEPTRHKLRSDAYTSKTGDKPPGLPPITETRGSSQDSSSKASNKSQPKSRLFVAHEQRQSKKSEKPDDEVSTDDGYDDEAFEPSSSLPAQQQSSGNAGPHRGSGSTHSTTADNKILPAHDALPPKKQSLLFAQEDDGLPPLKVYEASDSKPTRYLDEHDSEPGASGAGIASKPFSEGPKGVENDETGHTASPNPYEKSLDTASQQQGLPKEADVPLWMRDDAPAAIVEPKTERGYQPVGGAGRPKRLSGSGAQGPLGPLGEVVTGGARPAMRGRPTGMLGGPIAAVPTAKAEPSWLTEDSPRKIESVAAPAKPFRDVIHPPKAHGIARELASAPDDQLIGGKNELPLWLQ